MKERWEDRGRLKMDGLRNEGVRAWLEVGCAGEQLLGVQLQLLTLPSVAGLLLPQNGTKPWSPMWCTPTTTNTQFFLPRNSAAAMAPASLPSSMVWSEPQAACWG